MKNKTKRRSLLALVSLLMVACMTLLAFPVSATGTGDGDAWDTEAFFEEITGTNFTKDVFDVLDGKSKTDGRWGFADNPYVINTEEQFMYLALAVNGGETAGWGNKDHDNDPNTPNLTRASKYYLLNADLDFNNEKILPIGGMQGTSGAYFQGEFDGNGHTIKNFEIPASIEVPSYTWNNGSTPVAAKTYDLSTTCALFGYFIVGNDSQTPFVKNLNVENGKLGGTRCGGIVAFSKGNLIIENCHVSNITFTAPKLWQIGGIVGYSLASAASSTKGTTISNCTTDVDITSVGDGLYMGGIIGYSSYGTVVVKDCIAMGDITVTEADASDNGIMTLNIGGIMGGAERGNITDPLTSRAIENCIYTGNINVTAAATLENEKLFVGGIVGSFKNGVLIKNTAMYGTVNVKSSAADTVTFGAGVFAGAFGYLTTSAVDINSPNSISNCACLVPAGVGIGDAAYDTVELKGKYEDGSIKLDAVGVSEMWTHEEGISFVSAPTADFQMDLYGTQTTTPADVNHDDNADTPAIKANDIRFVATLGDANSDTDADILSKYSKVGFVITAVYGTSAKVYDLEVNSVYTSIKANGEDVTAASLGGDYIVAIAVDNIPAAETDFVGFLVIPKLVSVDGTTTYGELVSLEFVGGVYQ